MKAANDKPDSRLERLIRWELGETPGPWDIVLYPTNRCNLRCKICWPRLSEHAFEKVDTEKEVSDARLLKLVDEAADLGVREWIFCGGGDPLMRADLVMEMCDRIVRRGMNGEVHCNGTLYKSEYMEHLVGIGWHKAGFSLDGPDASVNDAIRTEGSFERATRNIRRLRDLKRERQVDKPWIGVHAVVTKTNYDKIDQMVQLTHDLGGRYFGVVTLRTFGGTNEEFTLDDSHYAGLHQNLRQGIDLASRLGVSTNLWTLLPPAEQMGRHRREPVGDGRFSDAACFEPWIGMGIVAEGGRGGPCSAFWEKDADSINDKSLAAIWHGPYLQGVRQRIRERKNMPLYCQRCPSFFHGQREELRSGLLAWERARWSEASISHRVQLAAQRIISGIRRRGLRPTLRRAREWAQLRLR